MVHWGWAIDGLREVRGRVREPVERTGQGADGGTADEVEGACRVEEHRKELEGRERLGQEGEYDDQEDEEEYEGEEEEDEMHFTNGHTARASFVVGFDGLHSSVRAALFGAEAPKLTGIVQVCLYPRHFTSEATWTHQSAIYIHTESRQAASPPSRTPTRATSPRLRAGARRWYSATA